MILSASPKALSLGRLCQVYFRHAHFITSSKKGGVNLARRENFSKSVNLDLQNVKKILENASVEDGDRLCKIVTGYFSGIAIGCVSKAIAGTGFFGYRLEILSACHIMQKKGLDIYPKKVYSYFNSPNNSVSR